MTPRLLPLVAAVAGGSAAAALALSAPSAAREPLADPTTSPRPTRSAQPAEGPQFASPCKFSHRASDDPIVFPGQPGKSHSHDFIGNKTTNASSTHRSLRAGGTVCVRTGDTAAYWTPTLLQNGRPVAVNGTNIYYTPGGKDHTKIRAFPAGLKIIAGDAKATSAQDMRVTHWKCAGENTGVRPSSTPPTCPEGSALVLTVRFPDCWNGKNTDSADHKAHMAYSARRACPSTHPVPVPSLALNVRYATRGGSGLELASHGVYSGHADFFNAWDQRLLERLIRDCLNAGVHCGRGTPGQSPTPRPTRTPSRA